MRNLLWIGWCLLDLNLIHYLKMIVHERSEVTKTPVWMLHLNMFYFPLELLLTFNWRRKRFTHKNRIQDTSSCIWKAIPRFPLLHVSASPSFLWVRGGRETREKEQLHCAKHVKSHFIRVRLWNTSQRCSALHHNDTTTLSWMQRWKQQTVPGVQSTYCNNK